MTKSLAEFAASAAKKVEIIFCRGVYLAENTAQAASVEFVCPQADKLCARQTAKNWRKSPKGFFGKLKKPARSAGFFLFHFLFHPGMEQTNGKIHGFVFQVAVGILIPEIAQPGRKFLVPMPELDTDAQAVE